jgi:hypothetical protein
MKLCGEERRGAPPHRLCAGRPGIVGVYMGNTGFLHSVFIFQADNRSERGGTGLWFGSSSTLSAPFWKDGRAFQ